MFPCSCLKKYQQYARRNLQARIKYKIIGTFLRQLSTELETAVTQKCEKKISVNIHLVIRTLKRDTQDGKQYILFVSV